jgi:glyoxylase I family protein
MGENLTLDRSSRTVVSRMEHVHLTVADLDRSIDWYERAFGFTVRWTDGSTAHVGTDRFYVAMTAHEGLPPSLGNATGTARIAHFAFTTPDLDAFIDRLSGAGIALWADASRIEGDAVYLNDPDGNNIEVLAYRDGYVYA